MSVKLSPCSNKSNPTQKLQPKDAGQYQNPLKKYFSISWEQMMAATTQQQSLDLPSP